MVDHQKLALFAEDVLIYLSNPTQSLPALMTCLNEYGSFSGYKLNVQKTQILSFVYNPPIDLCQEYQLNWDEKSIKYLGIHIPKDLSKIAEINYTPVIKEIKEDIHRVEPDNLSKPQITYRIHQDEHPAKGFIPFSVNTLRISRKTISRLRQINF